LKTEFSFAEVDKDGNELEKPRTFTIDGDVVYVDAKVIKFEDDLITVPDPVRSTAVCQFRRLFGEAQKPIEGFPLDPSGSRPAVYGKGEAMSDMEREIWTHFWDYANNPSLGEGVRAAHGAAPFMKLMPGKQYRVLLRATGDLTIVPEDKPQPATDGVY
jgi:hypothetical protein